LSGYSEPAVVLCVMSRASEAGILRASGSISTLDQLFHPFLALFLATIISLASCSLEDLDAVRRGGVISIPLLAGVVSCRVGYGTSGVLLTLGGVAWVD
jgi:hypothetical protein